MADTQTAKYNLGLTVEEVKDLGLDNVADPTITHTLGSHADTLTATTTPPVTKTYSDDLALVAGAKTIDLQALPSSESTTVNFTGLKVQLIKITTPATNTAEVTFDVGAANGYNLFGATNATDESIALPPDSVHQVKYNQALEDVDATHSDVDVSSSDVDADFSIILVAG